MPLDPASFKDKVTFITGASSGIGRSTAQEFAKCGALVVCVDLDEVMGQETLKMIQVFSPRSVFFKADVSDFKQTKAAVDFAIHIFGRLDFVFNNAGTEGVPMPLALASEDHFDRVIGVNLKGVWNCMRHQIPHMLKQKSGSIVNCSSIAGLVGFPNSSGYVASKHGVIGLTKTAALELAESGIRVNAICPGVIETPMIDRYVKGNDEARKQLAAGEPMGRVGRPEEIAGSVMWLCSDLSTFVTGQAIAVDGGWVAR